MDERVYVKVLATFDDAGVMLPVSLTWEDGHVYTIDRILDIRQAAALKAGSGGDRYTIKIKGKESFLFFERNASLKGNNIGRWFVERK